MFSEIKRTFSTLYESINTLKFSKTRENLDNVTKKFDD
jgi:hypothetical protein